MNSEEIATFLKSHVRTVRDWPLPGINFRDVTTLFSDADTLRVMVEALSLACLRHEVDVIAGVDARGFVIGAALAYQMGKPFVLVRKKGKLPYKTISQDYALEYGTATIEVHEDACQPGQRVMIIDDLIATGGTLLAAVKLFRQLRAEVVGVSAIIDLPDLGGGEKLKSEGLVVQTLCAFSESE